MPKADLIAGVSLTAIGLALLFWIIPLQTEQNTGAAVPPDLLPNICAIGIAVLAAILTVRAARNTAPAGEVPAGTEWAAMVAIVIVVIVGAVLFEYVHPAAAGFFVCLAPMLYMGERRWYLLLALPGTLVLAVYLLFYEVLGTAIQ